MDTWTIQEIFFKINSKILSKIILFNFRNNSVSILWKSSSSEINHTKDINSLYINEIKDIKIYKESLFDIKINEIKKDIYLKSERN